MMGATKVKQSADDETGGEMQEYTLTAMVQHCGQGAGEGHFVTYGRAAERPGGGSSAMTKRSQIRRGMR